MHIVIGDQTQDDDEARLENVARERPPSQRQDGLGEGFEGHPVLYPPPPWPQRLLMFFNTHTATSQRCAAIPATAVFEGASREGRPRADG